MPETFSSAIKAQAASVDHLRRFANGGYLYALLDGYEIPSLQEKIDEVGPEYAVSLFLGENESHYFEWPPYLMALTEATLDWLLQTAGKTSWGVFIFSKSGLETLRTHLRRFLILRLPDGERWFFRFYDPRLLQIYLESSHARELELFYGPVRAFGITQENSSDVLLLQFERENAPTSDSSRSVVIPQSRSQEQVCSPATEIPPEFEESMLRYVKAAFPIRTQNMGDNAVREMISYGYRRAELYRFTRESDREQFVELSFLLGRDFDSSPELPWVQDILQRTDIPDTGSRMALLRQHAMAFVAQATIGSVK
jgi:hypothetical protein